MKSRFISMLLAGSMLLSAGCIKIRLTVRMNEDGSGQVIEDLEFTPKLVEVSKRLKSGATLEDLTSETRLKERLARMGKGVTLASKKVTKQADGSVRLLATYDYEDISALRLSPIPYGPGWEDVQLAFKLTALPTLASEYYLTIRMLNLEKKKPPPSNVPLSELEAQQIRQLMPIFKDMLQGFEIKLRLEVFEPKKWATVTRGHGANYNTDPLSMAGGQLTIYHLTDKHLFASEDGLMMVIPWRQVGKEFDLFDRSFRSQRILPHINYIDNGGFQFFWRAIPTPRGREYY